MATHATLAYLKDGVYHTKFVHYGNFNDVKFDLENATAADIIKSVDKGDSTSVFAGFYNDPDYCKEELGWLQHVDDKFDSIEYKTLKDVVKREPYTYVLTGDNFVIVYESGRRIETLALRAGDGKGAVRDAIYVKFMRKGVCAWLTGEVMQFVAFDDNKSEWPTLYIIAGDKLLKANVESDEDISTYTN